MRRGDILGISWRIYMEPNVGPRVLYPPGSEQRELCLSESSWNWMLNASIDSGLIVFALPMVVYGINAWLILWMRGSVSLLYGGHLLGLGKCQHEHIRVSVAMGRKRKIMARLRVSYRVFPLNGWQMCLITETIDSHDHYYPSPWKWCIWWYYTMHAAIDSI